MPTIYAAMLELDNRDNFQGLANANFNFFDNALSVAASLLNGLATAPADIKLFMAPEYTFSGHDVSDKGAVNINSLKRSDKHSLYEKLKTASSGHGDIVIVAGSIAYSKKMLFQSRTYLSVCPVLCNGQIILKYYKQTFDGFQSGASKDAFDTKAKGSTFTHKHRDFGVEICSDHGIGKILKGAVGQAVDVHLLISEGMAPSVGAIAAKTGGLIINCDMSGAGGGNGVRSVSHNAKWNRADIDSKATGITSHSQTLGNGAKVVVYSGTC